MKQNTSLHMIEQVVMILVFALAAALCLQCFVLADSISERQQAKSAAVDKAQSVAEVLKTSSGDLSQLTARFGGNVQGDGWSVSFDENGAPTSDPDTTFFTLRAKLQDGQSTLLGRANIYIIYKDDVLLELPVAWQEVGS